MAPKQPPKTDKAKMAAKAKAAEDKTFGLKNKNKSQKIQQFVKEVKKNAAMVPKNVDAYGIPIEAAKDRKKREEEMKKELNSLFTIKQPKCPEGVDPKSMVCEFFRHGQCTKGAKCKFSHDLNVERKSHKIDLFTDQRGVGQDGEDDKGMADWDQETLERAIAEKHASDNTNKPTAIICKFFLEAVEKKLYGWFWKCPNGGECKYRHALPQGYMLKSQMKELMEEEARNAKDITQIIEEERSKLHARTPINEEVFRAWHRARADAKRKTREEAEAERRKKGMLNGREIFQQEGFVVEDDASATGADEYVREDQAGEEEKIKEMLAAAARAAVDARERAAEAREAGEGLDRVVEEEDEADVYAMYNQEDEEEQAQEQGQQGPGEQASGASTAGAGSSSRGGGATQTSTHTSATAGSSSAALAAVSGAEGEALFGGSEDDDDDDELLELDDDDDGELEGLEEHVRKMHT